MKRSEPLSVQEIIRMAVEAGNMTDNFDRQRANALWNDVVGPEIARRTIRRRVEGTVLHVYLSSAPLKNELQYRREMLLRLLNEAVGTQALTDIQIH